MKQILRLAALWIAMRLGPVRDLSAALLSLALLIGLVTIGQSQPAQSPTPPTEELISVAWSLPLRDVTAIHVSGDGSRTFAVDLNGRVFCFDERGKELWQRSLPGVTQLSTSRTGSLTVAYAPRRPLHRQAYLLDEKGRVLQAVQAPGPIETALAAPHGYLAAIASGNKVILCSRRNGKIRQYPLSVDGEIQQLQFGPGDSVYVAGRNPNYVGLLRSTGTFAWRRGREAGAPSSIWASEDGQLLAIADQQEADRTVQVMLVNARNQQLWCTPRPGRAPQVRLSAGGSAVVLAYEHRLEHQSRSRYERRLAYFDTHLRDSWTKGGAFNAPVCVAIDRSGDWVIAMDVQRVGDPPRFRLYGRRGERRWMRESPAAVWIATASVDGRHVAVYRSDSTLELLLIADS